jgi:hypothetical protein
MLSNRVYIRASSLVTLYRCVNSRAYLTGHEGVHEGKQCVRHEAELLDIWSTGHYEGRGERHSIAPGGWLFLTAFAETCHYLDWSVFI